MTRTILFYGAVIPAQGDLPPSAPRGSSPFLMEALVSSQKEASSEMETTFIPNLLSLFGWVLSSSFKEYGHWG